MRDLEIRGAGNLLGTAQSGHILAVGFDLYCQLLRQAVAKLRGERKTLRAEAHLELDFVVTSEAAFHAARDAAGLAPAFFPAALVDDPRTRIAAYRELAAVASPREIERLRKAWRDRFGPLPEALDNLVALAEVRVAAAARRVSRVEVRDGKLMLTRNGSYLMSGGRFPRLTADSPASNLRQITAMISRL